MPSKDKDFDAADLSDLMDFSLDDLVLDDDLDLTEEKAPSARDVPKPDPSVVAEIEEKFANSGFVDRRKQSQVKMSWENDTEFYCCLVFQTKEQMHAFCKAAGASLDDALFCDGQKVARTMGIELPDSPYKPVTKVRAVNKRLKAMS
jgi:hypothetical protein